MDECEFEEEDFGAEVHDDNDGRKYVKFDNDDEENTSPYDEVLTTRMSSLNVARMSNVSARMSGVVDRLHGYDGATASEVCSSDNGISPSANNGQDMTTDVASTMGELHSISDYSSRTVTGIQPNANSEYSTRTVIGVRSSVVPTRESLIGCSTSTTSTTYNSRGDASHAENNLSHQPGYGNRRFNANAVNAWSRTSTSREDNESFSIRSGSNIPPHIRPQLAPLSSEGRQTTKEAPESAQSKAKSQKKKEDGKWYKGVSITSSLLLVR
jgi:hypothetical protein